MSPCFVIFCSSLITLAQHGNTQGYWKLTTVEMIDPLIGIITAISLCITFYPQLKNTFLILMQTIPEGVNIVQLKREILDRFQVIDNIHEFHIWLLNGSDIVVTCHIVLPPQNTAEYSRLFDEIKQFLQFKYGIRYITIQPEFTTKNDDHDNHHYHNYPHPHALQSMSPSTFMSSTIILTIVTILATPSNILVIWVVLKTPTLRMKAVNMLIVNLCLLDLIASLLDLPLIWVILQFNYNHVRFDRIICNLYVSFPSSSSSS